MTLESAALANLIQIAFLVVTDLGAILIVKAFTMLSIQPKQSASSTASLYTILGFPVAFFG